MKFRIYHMLLGAMLLASCSKQLEVKDAPDFNVTTPSASYQAGKEITFNFTGNAHTISFYSGETLKDYSFKGGRVIDVKGAGATLEFSSSVQLGTQTNQLSILASTDFNGDYSSLAKLKAATWVDITSRFTLGTNATFAATGAKDVSDLIVAGKPLYIAFKYITKPQATNGVVRQWFIQSLILKSKKTLDNTASATPITLSLADQNSVGFRIVDENAINAPALSLVTATRLTLQGNLYKTAALPIFDPANPIYDPKNPKLDPANTLYDPAFVLQKYVPFDPNNPYNDPASEHWAVSKAVNVETLNLGPDPSTAIKTGPPVTPISLYRYTYPKAGSFKAVFVGSNNSIEGSKTTVKEINLTITP
jgi:hypothetical protein